MLRTHTLAILVFTCFASVVQAQTPSPTMTPTASATPTPEFTATPSGTVTPTPSGTPEPTRVWTIDEIVSARKPPRRSSKVQYCHGGRFQPCVCPSYVSRLVQYRPSVKECGGNAAVVLSGKYLGIFSVVVRDRENRDRWPARGFGGCSATEVALGLNKCSAFKVQERLGIELTNGDAEVHCLGASGYSTLFTRVTRITGKLSDSPTSNGDPVARWCLVSPRLPLN